MTSIKNSIKTATTANWGPAIRRAAYGIGAAIAFAYAAGLLTGELVHRLNDRLAAWASGRVEVVGERLGLPGAASVVADALSFMEEYDDVFQALAVSERVQAGTEATYTSDQVMAMIDADDLRVQRLAPASLPTIAAPPLESLTVAQLRQMARAAGHRKIARSGRRAELLQVLAG